MTNRGKIIKKTYYSVEKLSVAVLKINRKKGENHRKTSVPHMTLKHLQEKYGTFSSFTS